MRHTSRRVAFELSTRGAITVPEAERTPTRPRGWFCGANCTPRCADRAQRAEIDILPRAVPSVRTRVLVYVASALMLVIVAYPAFRDPPRDSFPLSDYPMFSHGLESPEFTLSHALGVRADGTTEALSPMVSSANREVLQSMMTIHNAVAGGRAGSFCHEVAGRVAESSDLDDIERVRVVTSRYDSVAYFETGPDPLERTVHAECEVGR